MILRDGTTIDQSTARYKYADAMAEYLDHIGSDYADAWSGDAESPSGWFSLYGRRVLRGDDRGFVWCERYATIDAAAEAYQTLEDEYREWGHDAACNVCDNHYDSDEGSCWVCGSSSMREKGDAFDATAVDESTRRARRAHRTDMGLADDTAVYECGTCGHTWTEPTPADRCPHEYDHDDDDDDVCDLCDGPCRYDGATVHPGADDDDDDSDSAALECRGLAVAVTFAMVDDVPTLTIDALGWDPNALDIRVVRITRERGAEPMGPVFIMGRD